MAQPIKVLLCRFTLDGHDRGIISIIDACRRAGMEVIYIHFHDPKEIVKTAQEEDVDIIGISSSIGQHLYVASRLNQALAKGNVAIPVIMGGVIPKVDLPKLLKLGIRKVFGPGSSPEEAIAYIQETVGSKV